ncbi:hypothetical protein [Psychroflexus sediminis]|uniref:DUF1735 domain-containing protein n=1 Tax=Psychroflexus sediminis TaxID=470826 RepID=A0A1G7YUU1_9FLAO|nr:hypothetical protein [Psychroflexus sediminis]SDG99979.1 hypothetical protein SAMN04488027_11438 [Psychroflexus sediminis]
MKKIILLLIVSFSLISCVDLFLDDDINYPDTGEPVTSFQINVGNNSAGGNNIVESSLGTYREDQSASFKLQAQHYQISKLERNQDTGEIIYIYQPQQDYVGEDYVEILAPTDSNGNRVFESKVFEFQINVGN